MSNNDKLWHQQQAIRKIMRAMWHADQFHCSSRWCHPCNAACDHNLGWKFLLSLGWSRGILKRYAIRFSNRPYVARERCTQIDRASIDLHNIPRKLQTA